MGTAIVIGVLLAICLLAPIFGVDSGARDRRRQSGLPGHRR
jgi:hypothetical protein